MKLTIQQFAFNVGHMSRKVRSAADPFHTAYTRATPDQRKALRTEWMLGHLEGQGFKDAERILSEGKGDRKSTRLNSSHMSESRMPSSA